MKEKKYPPERNLNDAQKKEKKFKEIDFFTLIEKCFALKMQ